MAEEGGGLLDFGKARVVFSRDIGVAEDVSKLQTKAMGLCWMLKVNESEWV